MEQKNITIKNVDIDVVARLKLIRETERRQLAVILSDALSEYWSATYEDDENDEDDE